MNLAGHPLRGEGVGGCKGFAWKGEAGHGPLSLYPSAEVVGGPRVEDVLGLQDPGRQSVSRIVGQNRDRPLSQNGACVVVLVDKMDGRARKGGP